MHFSIPNLFHSERTPEPASVASAGTRPDVTWNRPVFKAPPLEITTLKLDAESVIEELRRAVHLDR